MADKEPEEVWQGKTELGAKVTLSTAPHLGDGLLLATRMDDPNDGRWFTVYLDLDTISALGGTLVGFSFRRMLESLGGGNAED